MRLDSKWIVGPAAGLVLLVGGVGVASAVAGDDLPASITSTIRTHDRTDDRTADRGRGTDDPTNDDRGARSGQDSAADLNDDRRSDRTATDDRDADRIGGSPAERAQAAAVAAVPGATVREVERASETPGAAYHVELVQRDGTRMEVDLNADFEPIHIERSGHDG
jgi:uncharacterized membrane protein YkoI